MLIYIVTRILINIVMIFHINRYIFATDKLASMHLVVILPLPHIFNKSR